MLLFTKNETIGYRGLSILLIIIHNLTHVIFPYRENEMSYDVERAITFLEKYHNDYIISFFSSMGWIGVTIFVFLSGYGLAIKYKNEESITISWIGKHWFKLFLLMLLPYLFLNIRRDLTAWEFASHLSLLSNVFNLRIDPGSYWYFGMCFQLYLFFGLFHKYLRNNYICISLILLPLFLLLILDVHGVEYVRHNCIGWIPIFVLGNVCASAKLKYDNRYDKWLLLLLIPLVILLYYINTKNRFTWILSDFVGLAIILSTKALISNRIFVYLGSISAFIFAVHPVVRHYWLNYSSFLDNSDYSSLFKFAYIISFVVICIVLSIIYQKVHTIILRFIERDKRQ